MVEHNRADLNLVEQLQATEGALIAVMAAIARLEPDMQAEMLWQLRMATRMSGPMAAAVLDHFMGLAERIDPEPGSHAAASERRMPS
jgi:hypothetical protein